jgi:anaerobic glycerol-3-phosphate dehydrogenase
VDFSQAHGSAFVNPSGMKKQQKKTKKTWRLSTIYSCRRTINYGNDIPVITGIQKEFSWITAVKISGLWYYSMGHAISLVLTSVRARHVQDIDLNTSWRSTATKREGDIVLISS